MKILVFIKKSNNLNKHKKIKDIREDKGMTTPQSRAGTKPPSIMSTP